jgi:hypothetical protein
VNIGFFDDLDIDLELFGVFGVGVWHAHIFLRFAGFAFTGVGAEASSFATPDFLPLKAPRLRLLNDKDFKPLFKYARKLCNGSMSSTNPCIVSTR